MGAKKITCIEKVSAVGEPAPENLRHHAIADRTEGLPASASESLVSPHRPMGPPRPTGRFSCNGRQGNLGVPVLDLTVRVPAPPLFFLLDWRIFLCGHRAFSLSGFSQGVISVRRGPSHLTPEQAGHARSVCQQSWPAQCLGAAKP